MYLKKRNMYKWNWSISNKIKININIMCMYTVQIQYNADSISHFSFSLQICFYILFSLFPSLFSNHNFLLHIFRSSNVDHHTTTVLYVVSVILLFMALRAGGVICIAHKTCINLRKTDYIKVVSYVYLKIETTFNMPNT